MVSQSTRSDPSSIPPTLTSPRAVAFWTAVIATGIGAGVAAAVLTKLLFWVQEFAWPSPHLLDSAAQACAAHHLWVLLAAGLLTLDARSIYDARLTDQEPKEQQRVRSPPAE